MPGSPPTQRQVDALKDLARLATERAGRETKTDVDFGKEKAVAERAYQSARQGIVKRRDLQVQAIESDIEQTRAKLDQAYQAAVAAAKTDRDKTIAHAKKRFDVESEAAHQALEEAGWETGAVHDANVDKVNKKHEQFKRRLEESLLALDQVKAVAAPFFETYKRYIIVDGGAANAKAEEGVEDPIGKLDDATHRISDNYLIASQLKILPVVKLDFFIFLCVVLFLVLTVAVGLVLGNWMIALAVGAVGTLVIGFVARQSINAAARKQLTAVAAPLAIALADGDHLAEYSATWVEENVKRLKAEVERRRDAQVRKATETHEKLIPELEARRDGDVKAAEERYPKALAEAAKKYEANLTAAEDKYKQDLSEAKAAGDRELQELDSSYFAEVEARQTAYEANWQKLIDDWRDGIGRIRGELDEVASDSDRWFLPWHDPAWDPWTAPVDSPPVLRFGEVRVPMKQIPQGIPEDPRLKELTPESFTLPAFLQFPEKISLLIKASEDGRAPAVQAIQAAMLRFLTAVPPGKVRFTIADPVGLGQNFSTFMNLKEFDELLVTNRIWTEQQQIEHRLLDLTEHMENVIQTYLRNEYASIEEYNAMAGEVAEPYRVLVVANYPANFSDIAQRRLVSIAQSGPRCGVYVFVSIDTKLANATSQLAKDLEPNCVNLVWKDGKFLWKDTPFEQYPLRLDAPPEDMEFNRIVKLAGEAAKAAKRVEVPFEVIAPSDDKYWTWDSRSIVDVPLGRAGATKFQSLKLGKGTSQHVLIAGKTGSGKSTLLHALITNAALMYSPKELELYLIDFKKGVEFKTYAAHSLPHARVIAVESEREFGLSVLQRLDVELKRRGDMYRDAGAQDVASYRRQTGEFLPRILLLVDEFQEFFIEDDKLSQESSLLLDRLVRQGRAFGVHVILGSQTLGGAYSLARTTIAQMAIRIALQCSEADSHLILSEDNAAARLLSRPGEAIYNDANGMIEGNHIFQVVFLTDQHREEYLKDLHKLAVEQDMMPDTPQLVFEGNLPAVIEKNALLSEALSVPDWPAEVKAATAWLGDAIAIKDPTSVVFRRQSGTNVLLIGQQDEGALGILTSALVSLATQHANIGTGQSANGARFYVLDGSPADSPNLGVLAKLGDVIPHPFQTSGFRDFAPLLEEVYDELTRRQEDSDAEFPSIYLVIFDLARFRDLRKSDDDFGYSSRSSEDEKPKPAKQLTEILREGPNYGIHVLSWCDTVGNLNRTFERSTAGEFELRVLFQMSINDSSALIDSPAAGRLGENRALLYNEEQGKTEKFRPYGLPDQAWLDRARDQLQAKARPATWSDAPLPKPTPKSSGDDDGGGFGSGSSFFGGGFSDPTSGSPPPDFSKGFFDPTAEPVPSEPETEKPDSNGNEGSSDILDATTEASPSEPETEKPESNGNGHEKSRDILDPLGDSSSS
ncbi:FtsK/SpoIIIE domain-containing protein [Tundrisphaera lichenicola]|uniref:FtsK/SpoIIIE domain-containing protein n=1 Tax=Tundrisphaera lichenicola TaxID=2029860 RepID=UPI003EBD9DA9